MKILKTTEEELKSMRSTPDMPGFTSQKHLLNTMTDEARKEYLKSLKKNKKKKKNK